jgi:putative holliday junction resolvase
MARIMAIDYGLKRVGIATTDPLQIIATALETIDAKQLIPFLQKYVNTEEVEKIVVGMPSRLNGTDSHLTQAVIKLIPVLQKALPAQLIESHDERFTSKIAMQAMLMSGTSKKDRRQKGNIDKVAATIILQSYLEQKQNTAPTLT